MTMIEMEDKTRHAWFEKKEVITNFSQYNNASIL